MLADLTKKDSRQREIVEVVFRNGWDYMRQLLTNDKPDEPNLPTPAVLKNILVELGPVYVKLGQLMSTRPDILPADYIEELSSLQDEVPPVGWSEIKLAVQQEIPQSLEHTFKHIEQTAIAAGSIGQIHRAILADGSEVALKVQRPGIDQVVGQDIALIKGLADLAARTDFGADYDIKGLAAEFTSALLDELDFTKEARYTDQLRANMAKSRWIDPGRLVIPKVHWRLTTPKLLALEWLEGQPLLSAKIPDAEKNGQSNRRAITSLLFRTFIQQIHLDGFFHADPHPGNIFYLADGRVALLDCGMMGRLDINTRRILTEMLLAVVDVDSQRCAQLSLRLAESKHAVSLDQLEDDYKRLLRRYYNLSIAEINFGEVVYDVLQVSRKNRIKLPSSMGLYAKAIANLEGVARTFDPEVNFLNQVKPLMPELFRQQLLGDDPLPTALRTALDLKSLSLRSPRQTELFLDRLTSETLKWNLTLKDLDGVRLTLDEAANRLSFSILVGALIMGAAIISSKEQTALYWLSNTLFAAASFVGLWLIISILRSGRLR